MYKRQVKEQGLAEESSSVRIRILTGSLPEKVYDRMWEQMIRQFLSQNGELQIIVWDTILAPGLKNRLEFLNEYSKAEVRYSGTRELGDKLNHFYVVGTRSFRKEAPHEYFKAEDVTDTSPPIPARICFNNSSEAGELIDLFDQVWSVVKSRTDN